MFRKETTFILGAGASWHYGYPTGEMLTKKVIDQAKELAGFFAYSAKTTNKECPEFVGSFPSDNLTSLGVSGHYIQNAWYEAEVRATTLATRLEAVNPTLIDYFLKHNPDIADLGKLAIAIVILKCEKKSASGRLNFNHQEIQERRLRQIGTPITQHPDPASFNDDWLRFVLHRMTVNLKTSTDLAQNKLSFVTFNYDTSLEQRLFRGLRNTSILDIKDVRNFFDKQQCRFHHVYGKVRTGLEKEEVKILALPSHPHPTEFVPTRQIMLWLNEMFEASKGLRTIDGDEKLQETETLEKARSAIDGAERVYILGYGFDEFNSERLNLPSSFKNYQRPRKIMFTNFGGHNRVTKSAHRVMFGDVASVEVRGSPFVRKCAHNGALTTFEVSEKNVYDALEQDFESFEKDG